ncbi:MAG TPA: FUSC family protein [Trebonia sp.]|jgi:hypothetical protein|nr:FUSC family protein [Trebonia sp.]
MRFLSFPRPDAGHDAGDRGLPGNVRSLARRQAGQLTDAGRRAQPTAAYIARLTATAVAAYLIAHLVPVASGRPVLAPLTAMLVLQASVYQTARAGLKKVAAVTVGVLVAVCLSEVVPFSWWLLGLLIAGALWIGHLMRLGDDLLEVPISAMLIFSAQTLKTAASGRLVDTLIGSAVGLAGGLAFARLRTGSAQEAVGDLARRLSEFLSDMADGLRYIPGEAIPSRPASDDASSERDTMDNVMAASWLEEARHLRAEIGRVDDALREAEESARLNPRALRAPGDEAVLRSGLETLEQSALYLGGLARSVIDSAHIDSAASPIRDGETRARLADVLGQLGVAIKTYGRLMRVAPSGDRALERQLTEQLSQTRRQQDRLAVLLEPDADRHDVDRTEWPLRGEILSHVDRLRTGLRLDAIPSERVAIQHAPLRRRLARRDPGPRVIRSPGADRTRPHGTGPGADKQRTAGRKSAIDLALTPEDLP